MSYPLIDLSKCGEDRKVVGSSAQRAGLYYERKVVKWFERRFLCAAQPELRWPGGRTKRPDILVFDTKMMQCVVVEVKHQYVSGATKQVEEYRDAVSSALPWLKVSALIVCGQILWIDNGVYWIGEEDILRLPPNSCGIMPLSKIAMKRDFNGLEGSRRLPKDPIWESGSFGNVVGIGSGVSGMVTKA